MLYQDDVGACDGETMTMTIAQDRLSDEKSDDDSIDDEDDDVNVKTEYDSDLLNEKLDMLRQRVSVLRSTWENGSADIHSYCSMLRNRVDLKTEMAIQELHEANEELRTRIKQYELDCLESFEKANQSIEWRETVHKYEEILHRRPPPLSDLKSSLRDTNRLLARIKIDLDEVELIKHNRRRLVFNETGLVSLGQLDYQAIRKSRAVAVAVSRQINIWDLETGELLRSLDSHSDVVNSLALFGDKILSASADTTIKVWDLNTGVCLNTLVGHDDEVKKILTIDESLVASASKDKTIRLWNMTNLACIKTLIGHKHTVTSLSHVKSKNQLLSGSVDSSIRIWDIGSGESIRFINTGFNSHVYSLLWLDDKAVISCGLSNFVKYWNMKIGIVEKEVKDESLDGSQYLTAICPLDLDNHLVAIGSSDGWIKGWSLKTGECEFKFKAHDESVTSLAVFETDENVLISSSSDGTVKYWDLDTADCLKMILVKDRQLRAVLGLELDIESMNKN